MAVSEFFAFGYNEMNFPTPTSLRINQFGVGLLFIGGAKTLLLRTCCGFDVFGPAASGRALTPADVLVSAELVLDVDFITGTGGWAGSVERISRADWTYTECSWDNYKTASAWTSGGGDVAAPPFGVGFNSPTALGAYEIAGLSGHVADAIANRGARMLIRLKCNNEDDNGVDRLFGATDNISNPLRPRLRVTYEAQDPSDIERADRSTMHGSAPAPASRPARLGAPARPAAPARR
jgi:hypothetical protein